MSVSGGLHTAFERIALVDGTALQIFTRNQRQWKVPELTGENIRDFAKAWEEWGPHPVFAHASYLINMASPKAEAAVKSVEGFAVELERAELLGLNAVVMHPGSHLGDGPDKALARLASNLDRAIEASGTERVGVLLENTAGQGSNLGSELEHLAAVMERSENLDRLGVCFDTCHGFAAGMDMRDREGGARVVERIMELFGPGKLGLVHLNDSKNPLGSRKDRHEHIGKGEIGLAAFGRILTHPVLRHTPMVLETPKDDKDKTLARDRENLERLRLAAETAAAGPDGRDRG